MALKYYIYTIDDNNANKKKIEIHLTGYTGGSSELTPIETGLTLKTYGTEGQIDDRIIASEYRIGIIVDGADKATYDEFLTADFQEYQVYIYDDPDGANTLEWSGYLRTANSRRDYNNFLIVYDLVAVDGLKDLKGIEYRNNNTPYSGHESALTIIDRCLDELSFTLGYEIHLNMYNDQMTSTQCALEYTTHDNDHLYEISNGEEKWLSMWNVISRILTTYNSFLMQVDGVYKIVNWQEYNSYKHVYNSALVHQSRTLEDLSINITTLGRVGTGDLRIMRPTDQLDLYLRDRSKGSELLTNGEFDSGTTGWTNSGFETFSVSGGILTWGQTDGVYDNYIDSNTFAIGTVTEGDMLEIEMKFKFNSWTSSGGNPYPPGMEVQIIDPNGNPTRIWSYASEPFTDYVIRTNNYYLSQSGNYKVRITVDEGDSLVWTALEWSCDYIRINLIANAGNARDSRFRFQLTPAPKGFKSFDVYYGDGVQSDQVAALKVAGANTSTWTRYNKSESIPVVQLLGQEYMNDYQANRKLVNILVRDSSDQIRPDNIILLDGTYYRIVSMERTHRTTETNLDLAEINTSDATLDIDTFALTSTDGTPTVAGDTGAPSGSTGGGVSVYQPWLNHANGTHVYKNVGIQTTPSATHALIVSGTVDFDDVLTVDTINEHSAGLGVTIDGVLLKDGLVDGLDLSALDFLDLQDTPATYAGSTGFLVRSTGSALEFWSWGNIDHDALTNFVANEHINHTLVNISVGTGLSGGGDISASRSISLSLNSLSEKTGALVGTDRLIGVSVSTHFAETISGIPLSIFNDDLTYDNYVSWTAAADTGSDAVTAGQTLTFAGGTNVTTSISGTTLTINSTAGGGDVSVSGTPVANELAVWVDATTIQGISGLDWDSTARAIVIEDSISQAPDFKMIANNTTAASTVIGSILQFWSTANAVARINFISGTDTTNRDDGSIMLQTAAAGTLIDRFGISSAGVLSIETTPSAADSADEILLRDATSGNITKLGIGANLSVSGGNLDASGGTNYWTLTGSDLYRDSKVMIGDNVAPAATLQVTVATSYEGIRITDSSPGTPELTFYHTTTMRGRLINYLGSVAGMYLESFYGHVKLRPGSAGTATDGLTVTNANGAVLDTGRLQITANGSPTTDTGLELGWTGTDGIIIAYDRDLSAYKNIRINGAGIDFEISGTDQMTINSSGNVEIPTGEFWVTAGDVGFGTNTPSAGYVDVYNKILRVRAGGQILTRQNTAGVAQTLFNVQNSTGGARAFFQMTASNAPTLTMRDSGGTNTIYFEPDTNSYLTGTTTLTIGGTGVTSGYCLELKGTNDEGRAGDWYATSDKRLKKNIKAYGPVLEKVRSLGTEIFKTFDWKKKKKSGVGSIAQDWLKIFPEVVGGNYEEYYDLNYSKTGVIALQALNEHILIYEENLNAINNRIEKLEKEVKRLKSLSNG